MKGKQLNQEEKVKIIEMLQLGIPVAKIAREMNICEETIRKTRDAAGKSKKQSIYMPQMPKKWIDEWDDLNDRYGKIPGNLLIEWDALHKRYGTNKSA